MRLCTSLAHLIALEPHQHAILNFLEAPVGEQPVPSDTASRRRPELDANAQSDQKLRATWTKFVVRLVPASFRLRPRTRCYGGPLDVDKVQTVKTSVDRDRS
jgi:hypothetical protein